MRPTREKAAPTDTAPFLQLFVVLRREEESKQPRFKVAWLMGMHNTSVVALDSTGKISCFGTWRWSLDCDTLENIDELNRALASRVLWRI